VAIGPVCRDIPLYPSKWEEGAFEQIGKRVPFPTAASPGHKQKKQTDADRREKSYSKENHCAQKLNLGF
jgi:hypothetical protein